MKGTILIVEDDNDINRILKESLEKEGFSCIQSYSGTEALFHVKENIDLVVLDLMLPGLTGEEVLIKLREQKDIPILVLSAKDSMDSKLHLLQNGADDYMTKPFNIDELLARIQILLKRASKTASNSEILFYKDLKLDCKNFLLTVSDKKVDLTKSEFKILELFLRHPKQVFSKEQIYEYAWEDYYMGMDSTIHVHISNIRKKLKRVSKAEYIETVWGIGFKLAP